MIYTCSSLDVRKQSQFEELLHAKNFFVINKYNFHWFRMASLILQPLRKPLFRQDFYIWWDKLIFNILERVEVSVHKIWDKLWCSDTSYPSKINSTHCCLSTSVIPIFTTFGLFERRGSKSLYATMKIFCYLRHGVFLTTLIFSRRMKQ